MGDGQTYNNQYLMLNFVSTDLDLNKTIQLCLIILLVVLSDLKVNIRVNVHVSIVKYTLFLFIILIFCFKCRNTI